MQTIFDLVIEVCHLTEVYFVSYSRSCFAMAAVRCHMHGVATSFPTTAADS